jgi:hypothetical protein
MSKNAAAGKKLIKHAFDYGGIKQGVIYDGVTYEFRTPKIYPCIIVVQKDEDDERVIHYIRKLEWAKKCCQRNHCYFVSFWLPCTPAPYREITAADLLSISGGDAAFRPPKRGK